MSERYFDNTNHSQHTPLSPDEASSELGRSLNKIVNEYPPHASRHHKLVGFYSGPTSISFLFFALSNLFPNLKVQSKSLRFWSQAYLDLSLSYESRHRDVQPSHCGIANEKLTTGALVAVLQNDESAVEKLCGYIPNLLLHTEEGSCEWLYGLSGLLYLLRLCRSFLPHVSSHVDQAIQAITNSILNRRQPWSWYGKVYLGAGHGII
jgi:hypothetical protein